MRRCTETDNTKVLLPQKKQARESNIELLRIITMLGVIILHYNNKSMGGGLRFVKFGSANFFVLYVLEVIFINAVNLFMLISGYYMLSSQKRSVIKPVKMIIQVIAFGVTYYLLRVKFGSLKYSAFNFRGAFIPNNFFVIMYCCIYFISPYINIVLRSLDIKQLRRMIIILLLLFSVYTTAVEILGHFRGYPMYGLSSVTVDGSSQGYSIVNYSLMYIIGAYIKLDETFLRKIKLPVLSALFVLLSGIEVLWGYLYQKKHSDGGVVLAYCNPIVIALAVLAFLIFKKLNIGSSRVINFLAKACFTVYLFHTYLFRYLSIEKYATGNPFILAIYTVGSAISIYLISFAVFCIYDFITSPIYRLFEKKIGSGTYTVPITEKGGLA